MSKEENLIVPFENATGSIRYNMTNDAMFHLVLLKNREALVGLISALMHRKPEDLETLQILNPVLMGKTVKGKKNILDVLVQFSGSEIMNLEMQVKKNSDWAERSLLYLCREYDTILKGVPYKDSKTAYHIGFLDFTLFSDHPEFYATYRMRNVRDGYEYSGKFNLSVIELNHIDMATEEDKLYGVDKWARVFKAKTWEELKMLAKENPYIESAAKSIFEYNNDEIYEAIFHDREDVTDLLRRDINTLQDQVTEKDRIIAELKARLERENQINKKAAVKEISDEERARLQNEAREDYNRSQATFHGYYKDQIDDLKAENESLRKRIRELEAK